MTKQTAQEWLKQEIKKAENDFWEFEFIDIALIDRGEFGKFVDIIIDTAVSYDPQPVEFSIESLKRAISIAEQYKNMEE